jgi:hypothetical protein
MSLLTRDEILQADDLKRESVPVPEWGGAVMVRGLDGEERDAYEATIINQRGTDVKMNLNNARAKLVQRSIVDADGVLLFDESDVKRLAKKSAAALQRVYDVAARLSGLSKQDLDDLTKNSENGQSGDSLSG